MQDYSAFAVRALATFERRIVPADQEEQAKAQLTRLTAWLVHSEFDSRIGLLKKESGNNVLGLSVDLILDSKTGDFADVASSRVVERDPVLGGAIAVEILAVWVPKKADVNTSDPVARDIWVRPTEDLAFMPGPMSKADDDGGQDDQVDPGDDTKPEPMPVDLSPVLGMLAAVQAQLARLEQKVDAAAGQPIEGCEVGELEAVFPEYESQRLLGIGTIRLTPKFKKKG